VSDRIFAAGQTRRAFLQRSVLMLGGWPAAQLEAADSAKKPALRIGLVTDLHYGDKPEKGTRFYRETLGKLSETVAVFNRERPELVVELGDLIDQAPSVEQELEWLDRIERVFAEVQAPRHYVLGNHCVGTLTKAEFAAHTQAAKVPHYSFDAGGVHCVILDACFRADGVAYERANFDWKDATIPADQLAWLEADLAANPRPTVVFAHQRLDEHSPHSVSNRAVVRAILERSGRVSAVFQGHSHANDYQQIAGIHYTTLVAMIEGSGPANSGYAMLDVMSDGSLRLHGYRQQADRELTRG